MSNVKIENFKWTCLSAGQTRELGVNLLDGKLPTITSLGDKPFSCEIRGDWDEGLMKVVTDDGELSRHIDLRGVPFSLTYDLGKEYPVEVMQLSSLSGHSMSGFKVYASNNSEDLYQPENLIVDYHRTDNPDSSMKDWIYEVTGSLRYIGFLATESCLKDDILRLGRIALYNKFHTAKYRTVENTSSYNTLGGIIPTVIGSIEGDPKDLAEGLAYFPEKTVTLLCDTTFTYKSPKDIDINEIYIIGKDVKVLGLSCDGKEIIFTEERTPTYNDEETIKLSTEIFGSEISVVLAEGGKVDLIFTAATHRRGEINFKEVVCPDFVGVGTNLIPTFFSEMGIEGGANEVYWEMEKHHLSKIKPHCARMWFQIDWITDNREDYYARKYTFDSQIMKSVKKYLEICRDNGVEVLFNFGWKISYSIQDWFPIGGLKELYPYALRQAAPADLNQYGIALADTLEHLILDCGFDNIKHVTFYNEPRFNVEDYRGDFAAQGDKVGYWAAMLRYAKHYVDNSKVKGMVDFWGAEEDHEWPQWMSGLNALASDCFTAHTLHRYRLSYDDICKLYREEVVPNLDGKPAFLTEFGNSRRSAISWDTNHVNNLLAGANIGVSGAFNWILSDCPLVDPLNWWHRSEGSMDESFSLWDFLPLCDNLNYVSEVFYELCLFSNYVPNHSKSVVTALYGAYDDLRLCAFTKGGDYTVCVESRGLNKKTDVALKLDIEINKKFYKYVYRHHTDQGEGNLTVPHAEAEIMVGDTLRDTLGEDYELAVYSTIPPIRQVLMSECDIRVKAGTTVELFAEVLGCEAHLDWSISKSLMEGATICGSTVTVPDTAKAGEMLSVKAELPTGEFGISIIQVID